MSSTLRKGMLSTIPRLEYCPKEDTNQHETSQYTLYGSRWLLGNSLSNPFNKKGHFHPTTILLVDNKYLMKETAQHVNW